MKEGPEAKVKADIRAYLEMVGAYQFWPVQMGYGAATVDVLVCYDGMFLAIECKRPDTRPKPTPRQQTVLRAVEAAGGVVVVAYSVQDLVDALERR